MNIFYNFIPYQFLIYKQFIKLQIFFLISPHMIF